MKSKFNFFKHLMDRFYVYIIFIVLVPIIVTYSISLKTRPKDYESFSIFTETDLVKSKEETESYFKAVLSEDKVVKVNSWTKLDNSTFSIMLNSQGKLSDLVILSSSTLETMTKFDYISLNDTNEYYSDTNFVYHSNNNHYGIRLHDNELNYLSDYFNFLDDTYFIFINKNSVHLKGFIEESKTDQVKRVLDFIYEKN